MSYFSGGPPLWHVSGALHSAPGAHTVVPLRWWSAEDRAIVLIAMRHMLRGIGLTKPQPPAVPGLDYVLEEGEVALHLRVPCSPSEIFTLEHRVDWVTHGAITSQVAPER